MGEKKKSLLSRIVEEYKKVIWPSKSETFQVTVIVLLVTLFVALYILFFDTLFSRAIREISIILKNILR